MELVRKHALSNKRINPELTFRITKDPELNLGFLKDLEHYCKFLILETNPDDSIVVFAEKEDISIFLDRIKKYGSKTGPEYAVYDRIGTPELINPEEKIGINLKNTPIHEGEFIETMIYLWNYGISNYEKVLDRLKNFKQKIIEKNGKVFKFAILPQFPYIRASINQELLEILIDEPSIRLIRRDEWQTLNDELYNLDINKLNHKIFPPKSEIGLLVIDESIEAGHFLVKDAIQDTELPMDNSDQISIHHGTAVSALALYGDLKDFYQDINQPIELIPDGKLYFCTIYNNENEIDIDDIYNNLNQFLELYHEIKVVNLSFRTPQYIDLTKRKQLPLAALIDELIFNYNQIGRDLIFVICNGNFGYKELSQELRTTFLSSLKQNIFETDLNRLMDPSTSSLSFTIGSISLGLNLANTEIVNPFISIKDFPSPYTRIGPGILKSIKPDFVDYGSDIIQVASNSIVDKESGMLVPETNTAGTYGFISGSSFSAPIFTNRVLKLWNLYPELKSESIKCLITLASRYNQGMLDFFNVEKDSELKEQYSDFTNLFGYGVCHLDEIKYTLPNSVVLLRESSLKINEFDLYDIPISDDFFNIAREKEINFCISYTPPVKLGRQDYLGINLDFFLFKNKSKENIIQYYQIIKDRKFKITSNDIVDEIHPSNISSLENEERDKKIKEIIRSEKIDIVLGSSSYGEEFKEKCLGILLSKEKIFPPKTTTEFNTTRKHKKKWTVRSPKSTPNEHGYKLLVYAKLSKTKWFEKTDSYSKDFKLNYSIAVDIKAKEDNTLRAKIRNKLRIRLRV